MTSLYADTGIFAWARSLAERGSFSPARKVFVIANALTMAASHGIGPSEQGDAPESLVDDAISKGAAKFADKRLVPLSALRLPFEPAWDPYAALSELMIVDCGAFAIHSVKRRLNSAGVGLDYPELHDISTAFVNAHLRTAIRSFDPIRGEGKEGAWLSTVLYRFALRHAVLAHRLEANFDLAFDVADPSPLPDELLEARQWDRALEILPAALNRLPRLQQEAVTLYFGLSDREHAVREVAARLRTNTYYARLAVSSGVMNLAAELRVEGLLSAEDLKLARILLRENDDIDAAARRLGLSRSELKRRASLVANKVAASLRRRTVLPKPNASRGALKMSNESDSLALILTEELLNHRLQFERHDEDDVRISGERLPRPISLARARELLISQLDRLANAGEALESDLATIFAPEVPRADVSEKDQQWATLLFNAAQESLESVRPFVERWKREARDWGVRVDFNDEDLAERVRDSLVAVSGSLEQSMPRQSRREGSGTLVIRFGERPEDAVFDWTGEGLDVEPVPLLSLVRHRLSVIGDFSGPGLTLLAECLVRGLQEGWGILPKFRLEETNTDGGIVLRWTRPYADA
ncbi:hypothetical protein [Caballeronia sp. ATUFL_F1_KS39]|uniref:hypothetical protein n=1 Tax=Caballeronia sp. ATUFL_F1_KS39 TaxID=2921766 RepID=UPI002028B4BA|nr:hypothetical protein [Caballeronia sp. ATUFL_F1_KS39]